MPFSSFFSKTAVLSVGLAAIAASGSAAVINLSGGGTNKIADAILATSGTASTIVLTDSALYLEEAAVIVGPRNGVGHAVSIETPAGQNPTIKLDAGGFLLAYSGCPENVSIGTPTGGRIKVDATGTFQQTFWYIGQSNGRVGNACVVSFNKVDFDMTGNLMSERITFGAGGNDGAPTTTNAGLVFDDCTFLGGASAIDTLYGGPPTATTNTVTINNCVFFDNVEAGITPLQGGKYGINPETSEINVTNSVIYLSGFENTPASERQCITGRQGFVTVNHCDLINDGTTDTVATNRAITGVGATSRILVSNSILHSVAAGTVMFSGGVGRATDSNVAANFPQNAGFTYTNVINEYPVYAYTGLNKADPNFFKVSSTKVSATHGSSPPLGSRGTTGAPPASVQTWTLY